jgi:chromosome partitioning protein
MQIIGVFNIKGGVGKTAAAVNLGFLAARSGLRVLMWDLDPQGAASFYLQVKRKVKGGAKKLMTGKSELSKLIKDTDIPNLDLLPADESYREFDIMFAGEKPKTLKKMLASLEKDYDLVIFDCPPSMSSLSDQIFRASDLILLPLIPTTLSIRALEQLLAHLKKTKTGTLKTRCFLSMVDRRKKMHREFLEKLAGEKSGKEARFFKAYIPYSTYVERMGEERRPVIEFAPRSAPALAFQNLWQEIQPLLKTAR